VVVIDPGHGGEDYGVDVYQDVLEKGLALVLARKIEQRLTASGEGVRLTRFRDVDLSAEQRSAVGNFHRAKVFVSVHVGGAPSPRTSGAVVYVYDPPPAEFKVSQSDPEGGGSEEAEPVELIRWNEGQLSYLDGSRRLANLMQTELNKLFGVENRVVEARLAVLAPVMAPAVVVETGFLTNAEDLELLESDEFQETLAYTITQVIKKFLESR
jgi:N-acetylmuramoyl-L-alanine amidase